MTVRLCARSGVVWRVSAILVLCGLAASVVGAADVPTREEVLARRIAAGDLQYRDTRTGEIVVATEDRVAAIRAELEPYFDRVKGARVDVADDGTVSADINGAMRDVFIVRTRLDGRRERGCFRDVDAAVAFIVGLDLDETVRAGRPAPTAAAQ